MKCIICDNKYGAFINATDIEYLTTNKKYRYFYCNKCKSLSIQDPPKNKLREIYPKNYYTNSGSYGLLYKTKSLLDRVKYKKIIQQRKIKKIIDIGGGNEMLLDSLKSLNPSLRTTILDLFYNGKNFSNHTILKKNLEFDLRVKEKYDLIILNNIIEHVSNPIRLLQNISKISHQGTLIIIQTPSTNSLNFKMFKQYYWGGLHTPRHFCIMNEKVIKKILYLAGFNTTKVSYTISPTLWAPSFYSFFNNKDSKVIYKRKNYIAVLILFSFIDCFLKIFKLTDQVVIYAEKD